MKLPCRKCPECEVISDMTVDVCECGADLTRVAPVLMETGEISIEYLGEIQEDLEFYVQKCSACGTLNFTLDPAKRVKNCCNCHKARVALIEPVKYEETEKAAPEKSGGTACTVQIPGVNAAPPPEPEEEEDDGAAAKWSGVLGNVQSTMGSLNASAPAARTAAAVPAEDDEDDDEDDDDGGDLGGWGALLGVKAGAAKPAKKPEPQKAPERQPEIPRKPAVISFTAINYGRCSFSIQESEARFPVMLGRYGRCGDFLEQDGQVSGEHCEILLRSGRWYVRDNHSCNGTFLNRRDLGENGESVLRDGDVLQLGHRPDSIGFTVQLG